MDQQLAKYMVSRPRTNISLTIFRRFGAEHVLDIDRSDSLMSKKELEDAEDADLMRESSEDIDVTLRFRDEVINSGHEGSIDSFVSPNLDGGTLFFSRYAWKNTPLARLSDVIFVEPGNESELATLSRQIRYLPVLAGFISGVAGASMCIPGIFAKFTRTNQITVWRTAEMAKRQAMDHVMWTASKIGVTIGVKATFVTAGMLYAPFLISAYRGKTSWWEHGACFGSTMGLYCLPRGPVPMLTASVVAGSLGAVYGGLYYLAAKHWRYRFEDLYERL